ncbi:RNA-directed DNA polymerase, eukaryota, reverse transcriptase zinc-binding domain protein [Tanacetum coccineum]
MEVFNMIMVKNINKDGKFKYHHGCKEIKLTHMCFADDLMVLYNGDTDLLQVVKKTLDEFSSVSGLFPNLSKSTIFFGSLNEKVKEDMLKILPFKCGKLPMRYLGVPLLAKRLRVKDCQIQLIASVLSAMHEYWASVYILPLSVIKELEKIFKRYPELNQIPIPTLSMEKDSPLWLCEGNKAMKYTTKAACPKQAIILWMAIQRKLMTQDRMIWVQEGKLKCSLCNVCADSHDHLFFGCNCSKKVWGKIKVKGKMGTDSDNLNNLVLQLSTNLHKNKIWLIVNKLILSPTVYHIWMERNKRNFQNLLRYDEELYEAIVGNITDMLKCLRVKKSIAVLNLAKQWNLKWEKEKLIVVIANQRS